MPYKRLEDQYLIPKAAEMIEELKVLKEEKRCKFSTVRNYNKIDFQGHPHAGTLVHICILEKGHKSLCKCTCPMEFMGFQY